MSWYAVARGRNPGIYKTWAECQAEILNFSGAKYRKFNTDIEAINFVNEHGKSDILSKTQQTHMKGCGENITLQQLLSSQRMDTEDVNLSLPGTSECTNMSSRRLKGRALRQHLSFLEEKYENSMKELRTEIDRIKESIETFDTKVNIPLNSNAHDKSTVNEEFKVLQECFSELTKNFTDSVTELKAEINSLKLAVITLGLEAGQNNAQSDKGVCSASSSLPCKSNHSLILDTVGPSTTSARSYSTTGRDKTKSSKRKISVPNEVAGPSKVLKIEPPDTDDFPGFEVDQNGYVHVYTDGACENNGRVGARAGIGVWFADNHPLNYSERVRGRLTNNTAEIQAATYAIELAKRAGIKKLLLHTDSQFLISCITVWIHKWKKNDWKLFDGGQVKNKDDLMALDEALEGISVKWDHVRGHRGNHGNEMADALARAGAKKRY